nr:glycosyltransferase family 1 protein [uncultured Roseateles sp.]
MRMGVFLVMVGRVAAGPETYEHRLVQALAALDTENEYHVFCLDEAAVAALGISQPNFIFHVLWPSNRWVSMSGSLPWAIRRSGVKLLHATFTPPPLCPVDYVFTMHGAVTFKHPHFYPPAVVWRLNALLRRGLHKAKLTVCVSEFVKQEMMEFFGLPADRLLTVHHGVSEEFRPLCAVTAAEQVKRRQGLEGPYFLYVGKLHENKNIVRLIEAFHQFIAESRCEAVLVLVGRQVWGSDGILETIVRLRMTQRVRLLGHQPQSALPALYSAATAFVFPTLWEGFGLPVVEAMACGTPVIASNVASLPEVTGGAALLVDPLSTTEIAAALHRVWSDAALRERLRASGLARARVFDWKHTAAATLAAYRRVHEACGS